MTDLCVMPACPRLVAPYSRVVCTDHAADVEREMAALRARTGHVCPEHPLETEPMFGQSVAVIERVLIYGSRTWDDDDPIYDVVMALPADAVVICGGAEGADRIGWTAARTRGLTTEVYRADWKTHGKAAGPIRNQEMVRANLTRAYGFRNAGESRGTDGMTRLLEKAGIPHEVVESIGED